ncbi:MAG: Hsp20/alpha crystallin family protein [Alphaproteobacteria bacterium]|nr:Hsp20/alpha crystallin family protein [Alphaproteobacteria bacterium]
MTLRSLISTRFPEIAGDPFMSIGRALQRSLEDGWQSLPPTFATEAASMSMALDVKEDDKAFHVTAELPGLTDKDVDVSFEDGLLTIRGEKKISREEKNDTWHIVERSSGSFARRLSLSASIDADKIEAKFDKGVLSVTLPKLPEEKTTARKIQVKGA